MMKVRSISIIITTIMIWYPIILFRQIQFIDAFTSPSNNNKIELKSRTILEPPNVAAAAWNFPPLSTTEDEDEEEQNLILSLDNSVYLNLFQTTASSATATAGTIAMPPPSSRIIAKVDDNNISSKEATLPIYQLAIAGAIATAIGDAIVHPIDCIKTLQQSDEYLGVTIPQAISVIWSQSSDSGSAIAGFYRGLGTYLITDSIAGAIKFGTYETLLKQWNEKYNESNDATSSPPPLALFAGVAFVASSLILAPGEFIKQQLQMGHYSSSSSFLEVIQTIASSSEKGLLGFYTGYAGICWRDIPYTMMELSLYDWFKKKEENGMTTTTAATTSIWDDAIAAAITGGIIGFITTPLDTIKTKLMVDGDYYSNDSGFLSCMFDTIHDHGISYLFCGCLARIIWILPFSAIYLPLFDGIKRTLLLLEFNNNNDE